MTAAEQVASAAAAERTSLENRIAADTVTAREQQWAANYQRVQAAQTIAENASVFRRAAAQKDAVNVRSDFRRRWNTQPALHPTPEQRTVWVGFLLCS